VDGGRKRKETKGPGYRQRLSFSFVFLIFLIRAHQFYSSAESLSPFSQESSAIRKMIVEVDVVDGSKRNVADQSYCVYRRASWRLLLSTRYRRLCVVGSTRSFESVR
jgi:hypothetical protein